jgi:hypothetical protein
MAFCLAVQAFSESGALSAYYLKEAKVIQESHNVVKQKQRTELRQTFRRKKTFGGY